MGVRLHLGKPATINDEGTVFDVADADHICVKSDVEVRLDHLHRRQLE